MRNTRKDTPQQEKVTCPMNARAPRSREVNGTKQILISLVVAMAVMVPHLTLAAGQAPVDLGSTAHFAILAGAAVSSTGGGTINGDVGASPIAGSAIGLNAAQVNGIIYAVDSSGPAGSVIDPVMLTAAKGDLTIAYNDAAGRTPIPTGPFLNPGLIPGSGNIGGMTLAPGLYKFTTTALITGSDVTLKGGPNDVWIFQCAQDLQLGSGIHVILAGGAQAKNIFWQVGTSAVLGTSSSFKGTIMADQAVTMDTSSTIEGRALAFSAGVTFNGNSGSVPQAMPINPQEAMVGVPFSLSMDSLNTDSLLTVNGLPSGLRYKAAQRTIAGVPLVAVSNKVVTIRIASTLAVLDTFTITVDPLPLWAWGTFNGWCLVGSNDFGAATMAVTMEGKVTGKLSAGGSNYSFSAASYAAGSDPTNGFSVATNAVAGKSVVPLTLTVSQLATSNGPALLSAADGSVGGVSATLEMYRNIWKDADMKVAATNLNGYYTATLPDLAALTNASDAFGSGYLAFTLTSGSVKTAGKLADGTAVSLGSTLLADESNRYFVVLYTAPTAYNGGCFFGLAEFLATNSSVIVRSLDADSFVWENRNPKATDVYGDGFIRDIDIVGGWYDKIGNLYTHYMSETLTISTGDTVPAPETIVGTNRYASTWWDPDGLALSLVTNNLGVLTGIKAPAAGVPVNLGGNVWDYSAPNTEGLTFGFTRATGVYKGSFKAWFDYSTTHTSKSITFEGVMTPERENMTDGIEGRGFYLWADKTPSYGFKWSSDFVISGQ